ncbi:MAG: hypothetical protein KatS3mg109_0203 [Pirellulaceae bacterium]|nr:MAG: hypothetical protein KatS3mg109_0203 [Pirellulaceae bacterium]
MARNTLLCTVGTSLFDANLKKLGDETQRSKMKLPENWQAIENAYRAKDWSTLAKELLDVSPTERLCGAEINTIEEICKRKLLSLENIIFLVSDTDSGKDTGIVLKAYFERRKRRGASELNLKTIDYDIVEELQDQEPQRFKTYGLRNLVRKIGNYIQRFGGPDYIAIDATGGYKAQIAVAVIVGQALNIPVFYKHELFTEIINFPPLPVTFDYQLLAENADLLNDFEQGMMITSDEIGRIDPKLRVLLTEVTVDGKTLYELSPIGQIYLTGFRIRFPKVPNLTPAANRKEPTFGKSHHYPKGFKEFVYKVWSEMPWVVTIFTLPYDKQTSIRGIGFQVRSDGEKRKLIGTYRDRKGFGARFELELTDKSEIALAWAADHLNQKYKACELG